MDDERSGSHSDSLRPAVGGDEVGLWESDSAGDGIWLDDWCQRRDIDPCDGPNRLARWCGLIHPADAALYDAAYASCGAARGQSICGRVPRANSQRSWRWLHERGAVRARDLRGRPLQYIGVCIDIEDSKATDVALLQSQKRLRTLARLMRGYVFEAQLHSDGYVNFTWADDAFAQFFDCERAEVNRRGWHNFVDPRDRVAAAKCLMEVGAGVNATMELRIIGLSGRRRWLRMAAEAVIDASTGNATGMIGVAEDITDRKVLMEEMFASVNREQQRIGNDLHDELGQVLTGASLLLRGCHTSALRGASITADEIKGVLELLTGAIETTRSLAHGLAPGALDNRGLAAALENLASQARRWSGLEISLSASPAHLGRLEATTSDHLYRIVQEALTNIARHAHANLAHIAFDVKESTLTIEVSDDGIGIPEHISSGFGLRVMRYRAAAIGAELVIAANASRGTTVLLRLPLDGHALAPAGQ